jgi:hypothetical protein
MNRNTFRVLAAASLYAAAGAAGCGGKTDGIGTMHEEGSTLAALEQGAVLERAYVGVDNHMPIGGMPVLATLDLVGGSKLELEVVTPDGSPVRFEVWRVRNDGTATLEIPVDAQSGFALETIAPDEDGRWALRFPGLSSGAPAPLAPSGDVIVHADCVGGLHGCTQLLQPGETCPAGWQCDQGLACELPIGVCGPLAGAGTCVDIVARCGAATVSDDGNTVCGCDGRDYPSECAARLAGATILHAGGCGRVTR